MTSLIAKSLGLLSLRPWVVVQSQAAALSTSSTSCRFHNERIQNRNLRSYGYHDKVKRSGPLPRLKNDSKRIYAAKIPTPKDPFAPKRALLGQNDYIDILGSDDLHPVDTHYDIPGWLRGFRGTRHHQFMIRKRQMQLKSAAPEALPAQWDRQEKDFLLEHKNNKKHLNTWRMTNYRGLKFGPTNNNYKTRNPF